MPTAIFVTILTGQLEVDADGECRRVQVLDGRGLLSRVWVKMEQRMSERE